MKKPNSLQNKFVASTLATAISGILAQGAYGQSADANLRGKAPANSQVTAKNIATGLVRHVKVGVDGNYSVFGLPPGTYQVDAGPSVKKTVTLTVASTATLDLVAESAAAPEGSLEEITVKSTRLNEVRTSEVANSISLHEIETVPQISRNFLEFADTVPGMSFQVDGNGHTSLHSGSQETSTTNVYIDGAGQKNYVRQSGAAGQAGPSSNQRALGDSGNPFPQLAIGEYKVITSNYKAEYDQLSGAAITALTKSGTNEFHGEVFGNFTNSSLRAAVPSELAFASQKQGGPSKEYGAAFGGPIIQDTLHFFVTYEGKRFTAPNVVLPASINDGTGVHPAAFLPASLQANYGPVSNPFNEDLYFGKLDWEVSDTDRLEFNTKVRREAEISGAGGQTASSGAFNYVNNDTRAQLRWAHNGDHWLNESQLTYENDKDQPSVPSGAIGGASYIYIDARGGFDTVLNVGVQDPTTFFHTVQKGYGIQDDFTLSDLVWAGEHTIKLGAKFKGVTLEASDASALAHYKYYVTSAGVDANPFEVLFGDVTNNGLSPTATSKNRQFGIYLQDDWVVNTHFTANIGLRYDLEQTPSFTGYVTPANQVAAIFGPDPQLDPVTGKPNGLTYAQTLALAGANGININNYVSSGHNRKNPGNEIQPRLGFSYDINEDQRHVVFGGYGRAYDRNVFDVLQKEPTRAALSVPRIQFPSASAPPGAACTPKTLSPTCVVWNPAYLTQAGLQSIGGGGVGEVDLINNNLKAPYSDQFSIGMHNKLGDWNTSETITQINSHDGLIGRWGNRYADGSWYTSSGSIWGSGGVPGKGGLILYDNGKQTRNTEFLVSAEKPYTKESGWAARIAYTFSHATENVYYSEVYQFDYSSTSRIRMVASPAVPKHRLVVSGAVDGPFGVVIGGKLTLETMKSYTTGDGYYCPSNAAPYNHLYNLSTFGACSNPPFDSPFFYTAQYLKGQKFLFGGPIYGYRDIDLQVTKDFDLTHGATLQIRFDMLNIWNFTNFDTQAAIDDSQYPAPARFNPAGGITGVPRTFKLTMDVKF